MTSDDRIKDILRNQALSRAVGEIDAALATFYGNEDEAAYAALKKAKVIIMEVR